MKKSKCCNSKAIKQEAGNYFCSHCISICDVKYSFKPVIKTNMKTQKIKKSDLKIIYNKICSRWQTTLNQYLLWSEGKYVELPNDLIEKGYREANIEQKQMIKKYFEINIFDLSSIKSFDDILKISGKKLEDVLIYNSPKTAREIRLNAICKIELIKEVVNQGWVENWNDSNEYRYYPWFHFDSGGFGFYGSYSHCSYFNSEVAFYKTKEISNFVGKTFLKEYKEFATGKLF